MQTLKRWLNRLLAWWSHKREAHGDGSQPTHRVSWNVPAESSWRSTAYGMDQSTSQPGSISIIVEQQMNGTYSDLPLDTTDLSQVQQPLTNSNVFLPPNIFSAPETGKQRASSTHRTSDATSDTERHLRFLRYLVQRGTFDDDLG